MNLLRSVALCGLAKSCRNAERRPVRMLPPHPAQFVPSGPDWSGHSANWPPLFLYGRKCFVLVVRSLNQWLLACVDSIESSSFVFCLFLNIYSKNDHYSASTRRWNRLETAKVALNSTAEWFRAIFFSVWFLFWPSVRRWFGRASHEFENRSVGPVVWSAGADWSAVTSPAASVPASPWVRCHHGRLPLPANNWNISNYFSGVQIDEIRFRTMLFRNVWYFFYCQLLFLIFWAVTSNNGLPSIRSIIKFFCLFVCLFFEGGGGFEILKDWFPRRIILLTIFRIMLLSNIWLNLEWDHHFSRSCLEFFIWWFFSSQNIKRCSAIGPGFFCFVAVVAVTVVWPSVNPRAFVF